MKKKYYLGILAFSIFTATYAQKITNENVPAAVSDAFKVKFTAAEKVEWEMDYDNYEAAFKMNKIDVTSKFDKDGKWLETETPVNHSNLPPSVKGCLSKQFDGYKENEIEKVETPAGTNYEFKITYTGLEYELVISDNGELVSKEQVREYKKED
jgi:hypothetical protein